MSLSKKVIIIPARMASQRFPGKVLATILGKPMIEHVYNQCTKSVADQIIIATDDQRIFDVCKTFGADVRMTSANHKSGTERCIEIVSQLNNAEYIMNVQGDEPLIDPLALNALFENLNHNHSGVSTLVRESHDYDLLRDPDVVKCVFDKAGKALYFSRSPIPYPRHIPSSSPEISCFLHVGVYAFKREALLEIGKMNYSFLEETEKLEQLKWIEYGMDIHTVRTTYQSIGVDNPRDLIRVEKIMRQN